MLKKLFIYLFIATNFAFSLAAGCNTIDTEAPDPGDLVCIVARIINLGIFAAGMVFIGMIAYGAIKMSLAFGDPKGLAGSHQTLTYALIGVGIAVGVVSLMFLLGYTFLGFSLDPQNFLNEVERGIKGLLDVMTSGN